jgi:Cft2 family RNA processing exonuclease
VKERSREVKHVDHSRLLSTSLPDHEFDNPIYATEEPENAYSVVNDASIQDSETNRQLQATYESIDDGQLPSSYRPLVNGAFVQ